MFKVQAEVGTLEIARSGRITGVIMLRDEDRSFPDDEWNDTPVVVLGWWLEELTRLFSGKASTAQCRFMDGPFAFDATRHGNEIVLQCRRRRQSSEQVVLEGRVPLDAFMWALVASASQVVAACEERGWKSDELNRLKDLVRVAKSEVCGA
ncbi:hypothetical protein [Cystobacter fuscus]|uniref:hypothetical protein n=1 Tax=Cystobacter fuscus TaxID=43 RepID=UPI0012FD2F4A|nr:hypothetical protein [Cystobacter fuscus]